MRLIEEVAEKMPWVEGVESHDPQTGKENRSASGEPVYVAEIPDGIAGEYWLAVQAERSHIANGRYLDARLARQHRASLTPILASDPKQRVDYEILGDYAVKALAADEIPAEEMKGRVAAFEIPTAASAGDKVGRDLIGLLSAMRDPGIAGDPIAFRVATTMFKHRVDSVADPSTVLAAVANTPVGVERAAESGIGYQAALMGLSELKDDAGLVSLGDGRAQARADAYIEAVRDFEFAVNNGDFSLLAGLREQRSRAFQDIRGDGGASVALGLQAAGTGFDVAALMTAETKGSDFAPGDIDAESAERVARDVLAAPDGRALTPLERFQVASDRLHTAELYGLGEPLAAAAFQQRAAQQLIEDPDARLTAAKDPAAHGLLRYAAHIYDTSNGARYADSYQPEQSEVDAALFKGVAGKSEEKLSTAERADWDIYRSWLRTLQESGRLPGIARAVEKMDLLAQREIRDRIQENAPYDDLELRRLQLRSSLQMMREVEVDPPARVQSIAGDSVAEQSVRSPDQQNQAAGRQLDNEQQRRAPASNAADQQTGGNREHYTAAEAPSAGKVGLPDLLRTAPVIHAGKQPVPVLERTGPKNDEQKAVHEMVQALVNLRPHNTRDVDRFLNFADGRDGVALMFPINMGDTVDSGEQKAGKDMPWNIGNKMKQGLVDMAMKSGSAEVLWQMHNRTLVARELVEQPPWSAGKMGAEMHDGLELGRRCIDAALMELPKEMHVGSATYRQMFGSAANGDFSKKKYLGEYAQLVTEAKNLPPAIQFDPDGLMQRNLRDELAEQRRARVQKKQEVRAKLLGGAANEFKGAVTGVVKGASDAVRTAALADNVL